jgi:hypothetical protein
VILVLPGRCSAKPFLLMFPPTVRVGPAGKLGHTADEVEQAGRATILPSLATISLQSVPTGVLPSAGGRHFTRRASISLITLDSQSIDVIRDKAPGKLRRASGKRVSAVRLDLRWRARRHAPNTKADQRKEGTGSAPACH